MSNPLTHSLIGDWWFLTHIKLPLLLDDIARLCSGVFKVSPGVSNCPGKVLSGFRSPKPNREFTVTRKTTGSDPLAVGTNHLVSCLSQAHWMRQLCFDWIAALHEQLPRTVGLKIKLLLSPLARCPQLLLSFSYTPDLSDIYCKIFFALIIIIYSSLRSGSQNPKPGDVHCFDLYLFNHIKITSDMVDWTRFKLGSKCALSFSTLIRLFSYPFLLLSAWTFWELLLTVFFIWMLKLDLGSV